MRKYVWVIVFFVVCQIHAQQLCLSDSLRIDKTVADWPEVSPVKKRPWPAVVQTIGLNGISWSISKYIAKKPFADISLATIKKNIDTGFVWDVDEFPTNLVAHPYQGGLYFAAARAWGMNYLESLPYSFAGSFIWEMFLECEPPSVNDLITTSIGGMVYGEVMHRISSGILDNQARGINRGIREMGGFLIDPMRGIQRLVTGEMWKHNYSKAAKASAVPVRFTLGAGYRWLTADDKAQNTYLTLHYVYNDPYEAEGRTPYEYFDLQGDLNIGSTQPFLGDIRITGLLFGETFQQKKYKALLGAFQQYSFHDSKRIISPDNDLSEVPYRISETAAFGVGAFWKTSSLKDFEIECRGFMTGILLGGYYTDYFRFGKRDYSFGSGFSYRTSLQILVHNRLAVSGETEGYKLYTLDGYRSKDKVDVSELYLDAAGDPGSGFVSMNKINVRLRLFDELRFGTSVNWIMRYNRYRNMPAEIAASSCYKSRDVRFYVEYTF